MAIIDLATAKTLMVVTGTSEDAKITLLCNYADAAIKRYLGIDIEQVTYPGTATNGRGDSGYYSGNGSRYLFLRQWPVTTLTSVYQDATGRWGQNPDGSFAAATLLVAGTDYALVTDRYIGAAASFKGAVERIGSVWPPLWTRRGGDLVAQEQVHRGNLKISYVAGWATVPVDIVQAAAQLVAWWRQIGPTGTMLTSESLGSYSYSYGGVEGGMPDSVRRLLSAYKLPAVA